MSEGKKYFMKKPKTILVEDVLYYKGLYEDANKMRIDGSNKKDSFERENAILKIRISCLDDTIKKLTESVTNLSKALSYK